MQADFRKRVNPHVKRCPYCLLRSLDFFEFMGKRSTTRLFCRTCHRLTDMNGRKIRPLEPRAHRAAEIRR